MKKIVAHSPQIKPLNKFSRGFNIVEVMVTLAIVGITAAIALPNLNVFMASMRVENQLSEMHRLLFIARNNAVNTGLNTTVCPLNGGTTCTNDWEGDISVFSNTTDTTLIMDDLDILIKVKEAVKGEDKLQISSNGAIIFAPTGREFNGVANQLTYCPDEYPDESNGIDISISGRSYLGEKNSSGTYEDISGNPFTCSSY